MKAVVTEKSQLAAGTLHDPRWAAVVARSPDADGQFFYSVRTTGVYCRPSCASRRATENVAFHATVPTPRPAASVVQALGRSIHRSAAARP
jgi:AraC family transcriptional regulator of adaptative response/methylated-DNA-[protein]-cysteine methyltransferase